MIVASLAKKGPVIVARDIAAGLVERGHDVCVWFLDNKIEMEFPCPVQRFSFSALRHLNQFDIIHSHSLRPDALAFCIRKWSSKPRFISTIHNYVEDDLTFAYGAFVSKVVSRIWRVLWAHMDVCVVLTSHARDYYRKSQSQLRLHVVHNGRPNHKISPIKETDATMIRHLRNKYRIIGASALITNRKGFEQIINALDQLPDHAFLLIGDGPAMPELLALAKKLNVVDRFVCLGFRDNARDYLASMDVYAMPSRSEGMPLAMLEAACEEVPIVCSDIPVFRELFDDNEVAFFSLDNTASLVSAIVQIEGSAQSHSRRAKERFDKSYSNDAMTMKYLSVYENLVV